MEQANIHTCILQEQEQQLMAQHAAIDIRFKQIKLSILLDYDMRQFYSAAFFTY